MEDLHGLHLSFVSNLQVLIRYQRKTFEITCHRVASAISMTRLGGKTEALSTTDNHRLLRLLTERFLGEYRAGLLPSL